MKDEKTKLKEDELIKMVSEFCDDKLTDEYKILSVKLVQKLGRKHNVPFKRGKLDNWASGVIYALAQINFLFDKSFDPYITADDICDYFGTKKSTASNKARDIRDMLNLDSSDEFLSGYINSKMPRMYMDPKSGMLVPESYLIKNFENPQLEWLMDKIRENIDNVSPQLNEQFLTVLVNSLLLCPPFFESIIFLQTHCGNKFFPFFTNYEEFKKTFPEIDDPMFFSFYDFCEMVFENDGEVDFTGVKLNPDNQDLYFSCEMMMDVYMQFERD